MFPYKSHNEIFRFFLDIENVNNFSYSTHILFEKNSGQKILFLQ